MTSEPPASTSPDPVGDPQGSQRHLLGLLGDDDPAVVQAATPAAWRSIVEESGAHLHSAPAAGESSVYRCLAHAADAEIVMSGRYRWILAHDEPEIVGYDQDLWVDRLHADGEPGPDGLLARVGVHAERGPESYDLSFRMMAGHDRFHLRQARETLAVVTA